MPRYGLLRFARNDDGETFVVYRFPGSDITRRATSRFQMNSTTSAPIVAVMKPEIGRAHV